MRFKKAFTMAEAILVMVILGIIATIMISTMRPVEFRDRGFKVLAKKVLGQIDAATTQILFNNAQDSSMLKLYPPGSNSAYAAFGSNLAATKALYNTYLVGTRQTVESTHCKLGGQTMMLKDGSCLGFGASASAKTWIPGEKEETAAAAYSGFIYVDVNDYEEPNVFGKDQFTIPIDEWGIAY
ncbi:type II secretion system protein [bacterium]|nr:type II secretion system protein [bacterium]